MSKSKTNLMHIVGTLDIGGAEIMLLNYTKALGNKNYNHYVYCFGQDGPVKNELEKLDVSVLFGPKMVSIKNPILFFRQFYLIVNELVHLIQKCNIKAIQSHNGQSNKIAIIVGFLTHIKVFPTIHSTHAFQDNRFILDPRVTLRKIFDFFLFNLSEKIVAVSDEIKSMIWKTYKINKNKILVIKNGIFFEEKGSSVTDENLKRLSNKLIIISIGRIVPLKNFDTLIKASYILKNELNNDFIVWIVGEGKKDGTEKERLQNLINNLDLNNHVKLLGLRTDIFDLMKKSSIFVLCSSYEGLSVAMIEAMASGLPILASKAPGIKEFIKNGINGELFPIRDHKTLAKKIIHLSENEELIKNLSNGAKFSFNNNFDMRKNILPLVKELY